MSRPFSGSNEVFAAFFVVLVVVLVKWVGGNHLVAPLHHYIPNRSVRGFCAACHEAFTVPSRISGSLLIAMLGVVKHCIACPPKVYRRCSIYT